MGKPEDIPQDVWSKAGALIGVEGDCPPSQADIARAIMAERDRCARIAFCAYERKTAIASRILRKIRSGVEQ